MPYIYVSGCDTDKSIQQINIRAEVVFSNIYLKDQKRVESKLQQIRELIEALVSVYFYETNIIDNSILSDEENYIQKKISEL